MKSLISSKESYPVNLLRNIFGFRYTDADTAKQRQFDIDLSHSKELSENMSVAIDNLTDEQRKIIRLIWQEDFSLEEICKQLNLTVDTILAEKSIILRTLRHPSISVSLGKYMTLIDENTEKIIAAKNNG